MDDFGDPLANVVPLSGDDRHFDRFYFNIHDSSTDRLVMVGAGIYPAKKVIDGFVVVVDPCSQRNLRFSTVAGKGPVNGVGAFRWTVVEPMQRWRLTLGENPLGVTFDVTWLNRTPAWHNTVTIENSNSSPAVFDHLVQSGRYEGTLSIDGIERSVDGWWGQRDRSRGVRNVSGGQGLHLWVQAQFPDRCISFLLGENRRNEVILLEGAVLHESGTIDEVVEVRHSLDFDDGLDLRGGLLRVRTESGQVSELVCDATAGGGFLHGAGYGGEHGRDKGYDWIAVDEIPLDGTVRPRDLSTPMTDRLTRFASGDEVGYGIFEFAHSRSTSYTYRPSINLNVRGRIASKVN